MELEDYKRAKQLQEETLPAFERLKKAVSAGTLDKATIKEIFISKQYRDYINVLIKLGFKQLYYKSFKEKEITKYECN